MRPVGCWQADGLQYLTHAGGSVDGNGLRPDQPILVNSDIYQKCPDVNVFRGSALGVASLDAMRSARQQFRGSSLHARDGCAVQVDCIFDLARQPPILCMQGLNLMNLNPFR